MRRADSWAEWIAKATPHVRERLLRFNGGDGPNEGDMTRGWRPTQSERWDQFYSRRVRVPSHKAKFFRKVTKIGRRCWVDYADAKRLGYTR